MTAHRHNNIDPFKEMVNRVHDITRRHTERIPFADYATVVNAPDPLIIELDEPKLTLDYRYGFFTVSEALNLEPGDRVVVLPVKVGRDGDTRYHVLSKVHFEGVPLTSFSGHDSDNPVGFSTYTSPDRTDRYAAIDSTAWSRIRGRVAGVMRALTHVLHYHTIPGPVTLTTTPNDGVGHTHQITINYPNTNTAVNPE